MSSPWRRADTSSPSTRAVGEDGRRRRSGHAQHSPYKQKSGSSSTDVWDEFSRLYIDGERISQKNLDEQIASQERRHNEALAAAAAEHERVREAAERAREKVELEMERDRKRREEEDIRALEAERRAKEEREAAERRRLKEDLERQEEEQRKRAAEEKDIETTRARLAEQKRRDETDAARRKQEQEDEDRRAKEREHAAATEAATAAAAAAAAAATPAPAPVPVPVPAQSASTPSRNAPTAPASSQQAQGPSQSSPGTGPPQPAQSNSAKPSATSLAEREALHVRYLDLHKRMKAMRKYVVVEGKKNPALNKTIGNWRRDLNTAMGQMTTEKGGHRGTLQKVVTILKEAQQFPEPSVDVSSYLISVPGTGSPIPISGTFVYLLNIFSKAVLRQLVTERVKIAEPIMVTAVSIFANNAFQANGSICLIDMLLAKYHAACPVLWGIYGNEKTAKGRARIGWQKDKESGTWIDEQQHIQRMVGLGSGYAALSLRDFSKSRMQNPYPPVNYWKTMSYIVNIPASEIQPTHFTVLKALIDGYIPRFVGFYGQAALVALRKALVEFPAQAEKGPARDSVMIMPETIRKDMMLVL